MTVLQIGHDQGAQCRCSLRIGCDVVFSNPIKKGKHGMRELTQWLFTGSLVLAPIATPAVQPYLAADKVQAGDLSSAMSAVESKLTAGGFTVIGRHRPKGIDAGTV